MKPTLGKKLGLGFACVIILCLLSAVFAYVKASASRELQEHAMNVRVPSLTASQPAKTSRET